MHRSEGWKEGLPVPVCVRELVPFLSPAAAHSLPLDSSADLELQPLRHDSSDDADHTHELTADAAAARGRLLALLSRLEAGLAMKFSHSLLFNSVPEWTSYYLKSVPLLVIKGGSLR